MWTAQTLLMLLVTSIEIQAVELMSCQAGYFSSERWHSCVKCSTCNIFSVTLKPCSAYSDTTCLNCVEKINSKLPVCKQCRPCKSGRYLISLCTKGKKTVCARCPRRTFKVGASYRATCSPCRSCRSRNRVLEKPCTRTKDALCGGCKDGYYEDVNREECLPCAPCVQGARRMKQCDSATHGSHCALVNIHPYKRFENIIVVEPNYTEPAHLQTTTTTIPTGSPVDGSEESPTDLPIIVGVVFALGFLVFILFCTYQLEKNKSFFRRRKSCYLRQKSTLMSLNSSLYPICGRINSNSDKEIHGKVFDFTIPCSHKSWTSSANLWSHFTEKGNGNPRSQLSYSSSEPGIYGSQSHYLSSVLVYPQETTNCVLEDSLSKSCPKRWVLFSSENTTSGKDDLPEVEKKVIPSLSFPEICTNAEDIKRDKTSNEKESRDALPWREESSGCKDPGTLSGELQKVSTEFSPCQLETIPACMSLGDEELAQPEPVDPPPSPPVCPPSPPPPVPPQRPKPHPCC